MKTKPAIFVLATVFSLAATMFAADPPPAKIQTQTIRIKSHGETVAELKLSTTTPVEISGGGFVMTKMGTLGFVSPVKGGITIRINAAGELPITLNADEVEIVFERKLPPSGRVSPLLAE
jgi:hypothetical protein